jgi:NADH dehydrogenase
MKKKILIVGGGFAGIELAKKIDTKIFEVWMLDKLNHHQFQPLFYQVATSQIEPSSISFPLRYIFKSTSHIRIRMAEVEEVQPAKKIVHTSIGDFQYDYLVLAMGCKTNFFNQPVIEQHAFTLKTTFDSIAIRNQIITVFEHILTAKEEELPALFNLVIVGAGPTGVELAGAFAEIKRYILPKDYPGIDFSRFTVYLIEGSDRPLKSMSEKSGNASLAYLRKLGVQVLTDIVVRTYDGKVAELSDGTQIPTATLIWSAGVKGNKIEGFDPSSWIANDRIKVDRQNRVMGVQDVFALGDIAYMTTDLYPKGHPQVANVAINQARLLAKNLKRLEQGKPLEDYEYKDLGSMATIGRNKAVVDLPFAHFKGYFAWLVWMFLHLMLILTVRNKLIIFINWAWSYVTKNSSLRLILRSGKEDRAKP